MQGSAYVEDSKGSSSNHAMESDASWGYSVRYHNSNMEIISVDSLSYMLTYLGPIDLIVSQRVCKKWHKAINFSALPFCFAKACPRVAQLHSDPVRQSSMFKRHLKHQPFDPWKYEGDMRLWVEHSDIDFDLDDIYCDVTCPCLLGWMSHDDYAKLKDSKGGIKATLAFKRYRGWNYQTWTLYKNDDTRYQTSYFIYKNYYARLQIEDAGYKDLLLELDFVDENGRQVQTLFQEIADLFRAMTL